jgi:hypothetical protein
MEYNGIVLTQEDFDKWWAGVSEEDKKKIENIKLKPKNEKLIPPDLRGKLIRLTVSPSKEPFNTFPRP